MITSIRTLFVILAILISSPAYAQDKVVVIPLLKSATPTGAAFDAADGQIDLTATDTTIRTVVVNLPSGGVVIANASGYMDLNNNAASWMACSITKDSTSYDSTAGVISRNSDTGTRFLPFGATRGFTIAEAGEVTFRLICKELGGQTDVSDTNLTVMFFPNEL